MTAYRDIADAVLAKCGTTYAAEAGIRLTDKPAPLYQLAVLTTVVSSRISADIAVAAAHELYSAGFQTPKRMVDSTWQQRVDALGRAHYRRYDESTATMLGRGAELIGERWGGDLRRLRGDNLRTGILELPGIGDVGADIFCREVQAVWPELRPFLDSRARRGAESVGLPSDPRRLADLVSGSDLARFIAGLVRLSLDRKAAAALTDAL